MALDIIIPEKETDDMAKWTANRDLFTDKAGKAVEAGDPKAAFLLVREGRDLTDAQMKQHEVKKTAPSKAKASGDDKAKKPAGNKGKK